MFCLFACAGLDCPVGRRRSVAIAKRSLQIGQKPWAAVKIMQKRCFVAVKTQANFWECGIKIVTLQS